MIWNEEEGNAEAPGGAQMHIELCGVQCSLTEIHQDWIYKRSDRTAAKSRYN